MGNRFKQSQKILPLIESSIKKGNTSIFSFSSDLLSNLESIIRKKNLIKYANEKLSRKNIYYIRHAESEHNVLESKYSYIEYDKWNIYDPKLSPNGIKQTNNIKKRLKENQIYFDSVFISPLTRAMQTYELIAKEINDDAEIIVTDFLREIYFKKFDKNKGKELSKLKEENKNNKLNFDFMTKEYWWLDKGVDEESEDFELFSLRLKLFILWIAFREDKNILIISHSNVFVEMQDSYGIYNAEMKLLKTKDLQKRIISLFNDYD